MKTGYHSKTKPNSRSTQRREDCQALQVQILLPPLIKKTFTYERQRTSNTSRCRESAFRMQHPGKLIHAIPNGGARNIVTAAKLKAEGVVAGVPDLFIPEPSGQYHGLFVEMKVKGGRLQQTQKNMIGKLKERGYKCDVCWSLDDFMKVVNEYFNRHETID